MLNSGNAGWFAVSRLIFEHHVVGAGQAVDPADPNKGAYSKMEAWLWLIANASFEERRVINKGREITLQIGELMGATSYLASIWNWTPETVRWFTKRLEQTVMITRYCHEQRTNRNTNQAQIISICNYGDYQVNKVRKPQPKPQAEHQAHPNHTPTAPQESNHLEGTRGVPSTTDRSHQERPVSAPVGADDENSPYTKAFEAFWQAYPDTRGMSKAKAFTRWKALSASDREHAVAALPAFVAHLAERRAKDPRSTTLHAEGYLNQRRFETLLEAAPAERVVWWKDPAKVAEITPERWRQGIAQYANGIWPVDKLGPAPGSRNCVVPPDIVAELHLTEKYDEHGINRSGDKH